MSLIRRDNKEKGDKGDKVYIASQAFLFIALIYIGYLNSFAVDKIDSESIRQTTIEQETPYDPPKSLTADQTYMMLRKA